MRNGDRAGGGESRIIDKRKYLPSLLAVLKPAIFSFCGIRMHIRRCDPQRVGGARDAW
jgi:hypothetical protein